MKWFFCFHLSPGATQSLIRVAVESALRNTTLEPYCICDDAPPDLIEWLSGRGVTVVPYTSPLLPSLRKVYGKDSPARGAFLRCHVPAVAAEIGIADQYALYTDYDVMFRRNPVRRLGRIRPRLFAVTPELGFDREAGLLYQRRHRTVPSINTGVMLMNLPKLRESYDEFMYFIRHKCRPSWCYDQTSYQRFYGPPRRRGGVIWDYLPARYNWKPCWGLPRRGAEIVHFHGPKPQLAKEYLACDEPWDDGKTRRFTARHPLVWGGYAEASRLWQEIAEQVDDRIA